MFMAPIDGYNIYFNQCLSCKSACVTAVKQEYPAYTFVFFTSSSPLVIVILEWQANWLYLASSIIIITVVFRLPLIKTVALWQSEAGACTDQLRVS